MENNEKQLNELMKSALRNQLSSQQEQNVSTYQQPVSRAGFRKPIKNPFSDQSDESNSDIEQPATIQSNPFPPKQPKQKSILQQVQQTMKWNKQQEFQIEILSKLQGQGMKDKKIQQLAKKYKTLNIAYQKQKTMRRNLEQQLNSQLKINQEKNKSLEKENTIKTLDKSQIKDTRCPACAQNQKKVMEFRLQAQNIKTQLNKAHRLIAKEIGENFNIDQALNEENSWKGRQQKIQKLKARVKQLQQKLSTNGVDISRMSGFTQLSSATKNLTNNLSMTRTSTMAQNKRKQFDNLKVQVDALKTQNQLLQGKVKALTSRKITLQSQMKELKTDYEKKKQILMEKSENDDKFISLLKAQNDKLKKEERVITKVVYKEQRDNEQVSTLKREIQRLKGQLKKFNQQRQTQKCIERTQLEDEKIEIKFPPTQKKRSSLQRPGSSKVIQNQGETSREREVSTQKRDVSAEKKKELENEYIKNNKYLKKLTPEEESSIYQNWKSGKKI